MIDRNFSEESPNRLLVSLGARPVLLPVSFILIGYLVMAGLGITASSVGMFVAEEGADRGIIAGEPRPIRSDEWLRSTPWRVGTIDASIDEFMSPLTLEPFYAGAAPNNGVAEYMVFFDASALQSLGPHLPDTFLFSLYWWLPSVVVVIAMPQWLHRIGVRRRVAWAATGLVVLSPAVAWWSAWPLDPLAWTLAASLLLLKASDMVTSRGRVTWLPLAMTLLSAVFLARTAFTYFPWALPVTLAVLLPTTVVILDGRATRHKIILLGVSAAAGCMLLGFVLAENYESFTALANTIYPGSRITTGRSLSPGFVFGAQFLGVLRDDPVLTGTNQSEISTGFTILLVPILVLVAALPRAAWAFERTIWVSLPLGALIAIALIWVLIDVPTTVGEAIPLLNRIPPERMAQILGIPVAILFAIIVDRYGRFPPAEPPRLVAVVTAGVLTLLVSGLAGSLLKAAFIPDLRLRHVWAVSIVSAALIAWLVARPTGVPLAALPVVALGVVLLVNPVMGGFGVLKDSRAADVMVRESTRTGTARWASDNPATDAVLMANGISSLSGQQWTGPHEAAWEILDPGRTAVDAWNRGTAIIIVTSAPGQARASISSPQADVIRVVIDPCDVALDAFQISHMVTTTPTESQCLRYLDAFELNGATRYVYVREGSN